MMVSMETELVKWITEELEARGWSVRELARRSGVSHGAISNVLTGQRQAGWDFCAAIAYPLDQTPIEVLVRAGKLSRPEVLRATRRLQTNEEADRVRRLTALVATLSSSNQECLLHIARGLALQEEDNT
jgi:transcriptional regulator with XRE-family HTH domain